MANLAEKPETVNLLNRTTEPSIDHPHQNKMEVGQVFISRPAYNKVQFDEMFEFHEEHVPASKKIKEFLRNKCACSGKCMKDKLLGIFPFINVLRTYKWKGWLLMDLVAGITVGVIHVPQSMGFALLTEVPPVYGLYSSFFPIVLYFFFGTSRHISVGTMAVISLMIGSVVDREASVFSATLPSRNGTNDTSADDLTDFKVNIATSVSLIAGAFQLGMSFLQLGVITKLMSSPFVGGFTAGAVFHIITSQVKFLLGLKNLQKFSGIFRLPLTYVDFFRNITTTNIATLIISLICIFVLVVIKEFINEKVKKKIKIPLPAELLVVIVATLASHFGNFEERYGVKIVGEIPSGIPTPRVPSMHNAESYVTEGFLIAIVSFVISISLAKIFTEKYNYDVENNQELFAYGICYGVSSFFNCFYGAVAPPRCFAHESAGGKSQVASLFSALLVLLVMLVIGPLFQSLPNAALAAIICVALLPVLKSFRILKMYWMVSKTDFFVWLLTWLTVTFLDINAGLAIGIGLSLIMLPVNSMFRARGTLLERAPNSELYASSKSYKHVQSVPGVKVVRFDQPLFYMTTDQFKRHIFEHTFKPIPPPKEKKSRKNKEKSENETPKDESNNTVPQEQDKKMNIYTLDMKTKETQPDDIKDNVAEVRCIIVDFSGVSYIDIMGLNLLKLLHKDYKAVGVKLVLASCTEETERKLQASGAQLELYPSIEDAVVNNITGLLKLPMLEHEKTMM